ncbi:hypothetical protein [Streptomyces bobili]|uniref:hypothetical protein n=1 Tax=Streptomyces bobili TaxID=67280 RepID=UPI000A3762A4|nr:hypothetical protein [Streptomyces bobili]
MSIPWTDIGTVSTAGLSAIATWGAWRAATRSAKTADTVARIERQRWHADLTPEFDISIERGEGDRATLSVRLIGPVPLKQLDEIAIRIVSSDDMDRTVRLPGDRTQEDVDAQVWGPCRFSYSADGADVNGQTVELFPLRVGTGRPFSIERTRPPHWQQGGNVERNWRDDWMNKPMRLILTCRREDFDPWVVPCDVEVPTAVRVRWLN